MSLVLAGFDVYVADDPAEGMTDRVGSDPMLMPFATSLGDSLGFIQILAVRGGMSVSVGSFPADLMNNKQKISLMQEAESVVSGEITTYHLPPSAFQASRVETGIGAGFELDFVAGAQRVQDVVVSAGGGFLIIRTVVPRATSIDPVTYPLLDTLQNTVTAAT